MAKVTTNDGNGFSSSRSMPCAVVANAALVSMTVAAFAVPVSAQEGAAAEGLEPPAPETSALEPEISTPEPETSTAAPEDTIENESPSPAEEEEKRSLYHKKVLGKLRIEGFIGPSRYKPGAFAIDEDTFAQTFGSVKGPEFGVSLLGAASAEGVSSIGVAYRQANYDVFKLMKVGLAAQWAFRTPYVHPMLRMNVGYAHIFDGAIFPSPVDNSPEHGFFVTFGFGVRVPIIRWLSFAATFDWSLISLFSTGSGSGIAAGSQIGGTFALTVHLIGVDEN